LGPRLDKVDINRWNLYYKIKNYPAAIKDYSIKESGRMHLQ
jgi:hypothetical protein